MKRCPECRRDYFDDSLHYCLDDGTALLEGPASSLNDSPGGAPTVNLPATPTVVEPATIVLPNAGVKNPGRRGLWIFAGIFAIGVLTVAAWLLIKPSEKQSATTGPLKLTQLTFADGIEEYPTWSPDGSKLAFSGEVGGVRKIFIKELESGQEKQLTRGDGDDIQASWSPDGTRILFVRAQKAGEKLQPADVFGAFDAADIWSVDIASSAETKIVENAFNPAFSPDGASIAYDASRSGPRRIWTSDSNGHNPQQITTDVSEEASHVRPRWSTDGKRLVFQNIERTKFNIRMVETDGRKMTWITNDGNNNLNPVWSQSGAHVYFSSDRGGGYNIWRVTLSAAGEAIGQAQQVTTGAGQDVELAMSPDGKRMSFSVLKQNADLWRLPVSPANGKSTGPPENVISTTREDSRGSWSPDGSKIAFNSDRSGDMNIWVHSLADGSTRQVTRGPGGDFQPEWSPDGKQLVFFSSRNGNADVWKVDLESGTTAQITKDAATDINPFYSPDGKLIAYQSDRTGRPDIWLVNVDGSEDRQLTRVGVRGHFIRWNKTGDALVFRGTDASGWKVFHAPIDGSPPTELTNIKGGAHLSFGPQFNAMIDVTGHKSLWVSPLIKGEPEKVFEFSDADVRIDYPVWSPDGKWVLFDRFRPEGGDIWMIENFE